MPVVPFRFDQFRSDRTLEFSSAALQTNLALNSFSMSGLFALTSPFAILTICLLLITPSTWRVPIAMSLTFLIRLPPKRFGLPAFFKDKTITSGLTFDLPIIHWSSNKPKFRILYGKCFDGWRFSKCQCMISNFPFNFSGISILGLPCYLSISFATNLNLALLISFVAEETNFVTVISSASPVFLSFLKK